MEEIEFRGVRAVQGDWVYGNLIQDANGNKFVIEKGAFAIDGHHLVYNTDDEPVYIKPETIGQYSNVKDCHGKKIYDGDIVKTLNGNIGKICRNEKDSAWVVVFEGMHVYSFDPENLCKTEIVGNIYENSELLQEEFDE